MHRLLHILRPLLDVPGTTQRLPAMEGLRAYAASVVFLTHFFGAWAHEVWSIDLDQVRISEITDPALAVVYWAFRSHYGVDLFFFLSGFLVHQLVTRPGFRYRAFLRDRLLRLYPVLLVSTALIAAVVQGVAQLGTANFAANLLLLNGIRELGVVPVNTPTWSLLFELAFYAIYPLVRLTGFSRRRVGLLDIAVLLGIVLFATQASPGYAWRSIALFAGAAFACVDRTRVMGWARRVPDAAVLSAYLLTTAGFVVMPDFQIFLWLYVLPCGALVANTLFGDGFLSRSLAATPLRIIGNLSYSFYLIHTFAIGVVFHFVRGQLPADGAAAFFACVATLLAAYALSLGLASALFLALERPYFSWKARSRRRSPSPNEPERAPLAAPTMSSSAVGGP